MKNISVPKTCLKKALVETKKKQESTTATATYIDLNLKKDIRKLYTNSNKESS